MTPIDIVITALRSLGSSKLRSGLTLLGIVIGITSVTVMMSIGRGVRDSITASIQAQGTNLIFVQSSFSEDGASTLTLADAAALLDPVFAPSVKRVAPQINTGGQIVAGRNNLGAQVIGVTPDYAPVRNVSVSEGQFISQAHMRDNAEVAVLSSSVADALFDGRSAVGQKVRINGRQFSVVGELADTGASFFGFGDQVFVPVTTAYYRLSFQRTSYGEVSVDSIDVEAASADAIDAAQLEIAAILRLRHRITDRNDFDIDTLQGLIDAVNQIITILSLFLGTISGIALLVGGIGVMNIMLVSVTERTREIGIRKAMGAKRRDIMMQFLTEAIFLTTIGGLIGLLLTLAMSPLINWAVNIVAQPGSALSSASGIAFQPYVALLAISVSAAVGLLSGIYPAMRASRMHPIDALRYE